MRACVCDVRTGTLVANYDAVQCCGGRVVSAELVCCGDAVAGQSFASDASKSCCGEQYVDVLTTHCCTDDRGRSQVDTDVLLCNLAAVTYSYVNESVSKDIMSQCS